MMASARNSIIAAALILAALCGSGLASTVCPANYIPIGTRCYMIGREAMSWDVAKAYCESFDGTLAQTLDKDCDALAALLAYLKTDPELREWDFWLGATDLAVEGQWRWLNGDLVSMSSLFWASGQPEDGVDYNCLQLWYTGGQHRFDDGYCADGEAAICSAEPLPPSH